MIDKYMMLLIKVTIKGSYEKINEGYQFQIGDTQKCIGILGREAIEFRIKTIKWIPGSYEPIEGSELYKKLEYKELDSLSDEEIMPMFSSIIDKIIG